MKIEGVQIDKIVKVLEREKELIDGELANLKVKVCGHVGRCAVGALLSAAGMSDEDLDNCDGSAERIFNRRVRRPEVRLARQILTDEYGMNVQHTEALIAFNDSGCDAPDGPSWKRQHAVIGFVKNGFQEIS